MTDPTCPDPHPDAEPGAGRGAVDDRRIIDALPSAIVVTDPDGTVIRWNDESVRTFGWTEAEVLGRSVLDVLAPADAIDENRAHFEAARAGIGRGGDRIVRRRDGGTVRIASSTQPVLDDAGRLVAVVGSSEDVTDRRAVEQAARDLADHFRLSLDAGGLGTWRWDMATGTTTWDARLESLFGLEPGTFDGTFDAYVELLHPEDRAEVLGRVDRAVRERSTYRVEHRVLWPDGSVHWIAGAGGVIIGNDGEVAGTMGCCMDVTERIQREVERARLAEEAVEMAARERVLRARLEFFGAIHEALASSPTREELMVNVTQAAVPRLGDWCAIHLLPRDPADGRGGPLDVEIAHREPAMVEYARTLQARFPYDPDAPRGVAHVIRTATLEFHPAIDDAVLAATDTTEEMRDVVDELALRSSITVPLVKGARVFGAMQFVMAGSSRRYTEDDVALAQAAAGRIASTLENQRLNELHRRTSETLQRSLLPATLPTIPDLEVTVRYWPAGEDASVGGDFYDLFTIDEERWGLVIGDVCGTGPGAAAITGLARHTIRASAWHGDDPPTVLRSLNTAIRRADTDSFCTAIFGQVARGDRGFVLELACGGHPLPILVRDHEARAVGGPGTLLGIFPDTTFTEETVALEPGDALVLYTDGATDVPGDHGLTAEELRALVEGAARSAADVDEIADNIHAALSSILPFSDRNDDLAVVVLRAST